MDEEDFLKTLEEHRAKWEAEHKMSEDVVDGPPSPRANATLVPCPVSTSLWLFGGDRYDGARIDMFADLYRFTPEKNEWRKFTSPSAPSPRSAHACVASAQGGGQLWIFGGEYASPNGASFMHFKDFWLYSIAERSWEKIESRQKPSARSGARMAMWKRWIFLFGGFQDTGVKTSYLQDLWVFDTQSLRWQQVELSALIDRRPCQRSGFSFLPCADGIVLHGGYMKLYERKKMTGVPLTDTWLLRIPPSATDGDELDIKQLKWEKRKRVGYVPGPRVGCTMALWHARQMAVLFGGVLDNERDDEDFASTFYNELYVHRSYQRGQLTETVRAALATT